MPCDDFDALIGENDSVFDWDTVYAIEKKRERVIDAYGILGDGCAEKHDPPPIDVDHSKSRISVKWKTPQDINLEWYLMPLSGDPDDAGYEPMKRLHIYEHPQRGAEYSVGIDPGQGVGGDRTIISVNKCGNDVLPDVQVAEFASDDIDNVEIYAWACCIAAYYSKFMKEEEDGMATVIIEQRRKYGDSCYHAMKLHGFRKHHHFRQYDKKTLKEKPSERAREGWFTNEWSRPMLLGTFKAAVVGGWYKVNSKWLQAEIEKFEQGQTTSGKLRWDHMDDEHDDRIFAAAMSYFTLHDMDVLAERHKQRYQAPEEEDIVLDTRPFYTEVRNPMADAFLEAYQK
jgi:hypothetical protein